MASPAVPVMLHRLGMERRAQLPARTFQLLARQTCRPATKLTCWTRPYYTTRQQGTEANQHSSRSAHNGAGISPMAQAVRQNMRSVKSSVSIITSCDPSQGRGDDRATWKGATVGSFNTVSMSPYPFVSFNIHLQSSTLTAIRRSGYFAVNVLGQSSQAAYLADLFARPNEESPFDIALENLKSCYIGKDWYMGENKMKASDPQVLPPRLQVSETAVQPKAVVFSLLCYAGISGTPTFRSLVVGDHLIVTGRVMHVLSARGSKTFLPAGSPSAEKESLHRPDSLTYQHGRYSSEPGRARLRRATSTPFKSNAFEFKPGLVKNLVDPDMEKSFEIYEMPEFETESEGKENDQPMKKSA